MDELTTRAALGVFVVATSLSACGSDQGTEVGTLHDDVALRSEVKPSAPAALTVELTESRRLRPPVSGTDPLRSLLIKDPSIVSRFPLSRVFDALRVTAVDNGRTLAPSETNLTVFRRWWATFARATGTTVGCDSPSVDPEAYGLASKCPRGVEAAYFDGVADPLAPDAARGFRPIAIVNRFDLAAPDGSTCGEYRVSYTITGTLPREEGYVMFAFSMPNPRPALGVDGCIHVARWWQALTNDPDVASRAEKIEAFFFTGSISQPAVVNAANLGLVPTGSVKPRRGQIEYNAQLDRVEWHLREWRLRTECAAFSTTPSSCILRFEHIPAPANPAEELLAGTHSRSAEFLDEFVAQVPSLLAKDVNEIQMTTSDRFNQYESSSDPGGRGSPSSDVRFKSLAGSSTREAIKATLDEMGSSLTVDNVLDRATSQTCGGCHRVANNVDLGGGLTWPASNFFTHIPRSSAISEALSRVFLPYRVSRLEGYINARRGLEP